MWIPGWDSIANASWWSSFYFWASIAALIGLGITEVASHRYAERKDELSSIEQEALERQHKDEIAHVQHDTALANERAAELAKEAARLSAEAEQQKSENLALQRVMAARHVGIVGLNAPPKAHEWFSGIEAFPGTNLRHRQP